jgi:hypothetical protein
MPTEGHYQPFWIWPAVFGGIAIIVLLFWALDRLLRRYFPSSRKTYGTGGNALMRVETLFLPSREHVIEAREREHEEQDDSGDPPNTPGA